MTALFLCTFVAKSQEYNFKKINTDQGLSKPGVYALELDAMGNMWIGTEGGGVNIYDGYDIKPYTTHNLGTYVRTIHRCESGDMWVGDENVGVNIVYNKDSVLNISDQNGLYANHIRDIKSLSKTRKVVATLGGGISIIENAKVVKVYTQKAGLPSLNTKALHVAKDVIFAATEKGLARISNDTVEKVYNHQNSTISDDLLCLEADDSQTLWIGANKGLYYLSEDSIHQINQFKNLRIKALLSDGDFLWLGTNQGLVRFNKVSSKIKWFDEENGLSNNRVRCLTTDMYGGIWMGTYFAGLNCFDTPDFYLFDRSEGLPENVITAIDVSAKSDVLLVGTSTKGVVNSLGSNSQYYNKNNGLSEDEVTCVLNIDSDQVMVGTVEGLNLCRNGEVVEVWDNYSGAFLNNEIKSLARIDSLIVGLTGKGEPFLLRIDSNGVKLLLEQSLKLQAQIEGTANVVMVYLEKVYFFKSKQTIVFDVKNRMLSLFATSNFSDVKLASHVTSHIPLVVNTKNEVFGIRNDTAFYLIKTITKSAELKAVTAVSDKELWLALKTKVQKITLIGDTSKTSTYTSDNGFLGRVFSGNEIVKTKKGLLLFPTIRGVFVADMQANHTNEKTVQVQLEELLLDGERLDWQAYSDTSTNNMPIGLRLSYEMNNLTFRYNAHYLKSSASIFYSFSVEGANDFEFITQKREVDLLDLAPGEYKVTIKSKSTDGDWSLPVVYRFSITPPFWQTIWFYFAIIGIAAMGIYIFVKRKTIKLEKEKFKLEQIVTERTMDLNKEKQKSDELLLNILPAEVANELKLNGRSPAKRFEEATVLFTDFKGFTTMSSQMSPDKLVEKLDQIFMGFDEVVEQHNLEKIKTIGDAYMCVGGLPQPNKTHAVDAVAAGLDMVKFMLKFNEEQKILGEPEWLVRVGIHTGELVSGVVGKKKFAYDVWGDTVNVASRMESSSEPNRVNISEATKDRVCNDFDLIARGEIEAKNRGALSMYFVENKVSSN